MWRPVRSCLIDGVILCDDDALASERAGVLEDNRAVAAVVLLERDPVVWVSQELRQPGLTLLLDRRAAQVLAG